MILIEIINIKKEFDNDLILNKVNFTVHLGKINIILGPSGCGKSTLLNIIAGLDKDFSGHIQGRESHKISYVFQEDRLLEWKSIKKNILFALSGKLNDELLLSYGNALGLSEYLNHYPNQLSGGLRQRVNLLRAFLYPATLLLMDEPFKSLDIQTKEDVIQVFLQIQKEKKLTVLLVTHNLDEAVQLGHYIHIFSQKPTNVLSTFKNPYFSEDTHYHNEDKDRFLSEVTEIIKLNN